MFSCRPSIEEQIKSKEKELKKLSDRSFKLNEEFAEASHKYADATEFYYRLQMIGLLKNDPECVKAKLVADSLKEIENDIQKKIDELHRTKIDSIVKQLDSLKKLK